MRENSHLMLLCFIIIFISFFLIGCPDKNDWTEEYQSIITEFPIGREILLPIAEPNGMAYNGKLIWAADYQTIKFGKIVAIDIKNGTVKKTVKALKHMEGLTWDGKNFWVGAPARKITKLDGMSLKPIETIDSPTGEDADGLAWDGKFLWIVSHFHGKKKVQLVKMDVNFNKVLKRFNLPFKEIGDLAYMNDYIWAAKYCKSDDSKDCPFIVKIDTTSANIIKLYYNKELPRKLWGLTEVNGHLWVNNGGDRSSPSKIIELLIK